MLLNKFNKIIFVLPGPVYPIQRGQTKIAFKQAFFLKKMGFKTILINLWFGSKKNIHQNKEVIYESFDEVFGININFFNFCNSLILSSLKRFLFFEPLQTNLINSFSNKKIFKKLLDFLNLHKDRENCLIYFFSIRSFPLWKIIDQKNIFYVVNLVDSMTINIENKIKMLSGFKKLFWDLELNAIKNLEKNLPNSKRLIGYISVSKYDLSFFKITNNSHNKKLIQSPVGVEILPIDKKIKHISFLKEKVLLFTGSLFYEPNVTAIKWLIQDIMPILWKADNKITLRIAGRNPTKNIKELCSKDARIKLIPNPLNIYKHIESSSINLAPMKTGSGQQFKIIEALMLCKPVVATSKAANPLGLENYKNILISDNSKGFANSILELLSDQSLYLKLIKNGRKFIKDHHDWEFITKDLFQRINEDFVQYNYK